jgi:hypothetical protein
MVLMGFKRKCAVFVEEKRRGFALLHFSPGFSVRWDIFVMING